MSLLLIQATGPDQPGILEALTRCLSTDNVRILDVGQSVIHRTLALGMLVEFGCREAQGASKDDSKADENTERAPTLKELLFAGHALGLNITFSPITL
ncbi:MAG: phosphoserine phosphatase, partial [Pseudomonadota bacterium]